MAEHFGRIKEAAIQCRLCLSSRSVAERSAFLMTLHKSVISTEGVAEVEKPAGKCDFVRDLTDICGRIQAGSSTSLRFAQNDRFLLVLCG